MFIIMIEVAENIVHEDHFNTFQPFLTFTTVFVDTRLWKKKHPRKRSQNFRQSYLLSTCRIEMRQSQPAIMT